MIVMVMAAAYETAMAGVDWTAGAVAGGIDALIATRDALFEAAAA